MLGLALWAGDWQLATDDWEHSTDQQCCSCRRAGSCAPLAGRTGAGKSNVKDLCMLHSLLLLTAVSGFTAPLPTHPQAAQKHPPVRVWFNSKGDYAPGERAKVYAKSAGSGYLLVLRADGAGRVRVLFPLDPSDSQQVKGDKKYELKGRGGREAFLADSEGSGTVLAAVSETPFQFDQFAKDGHWDLRGVSSVGTRDDAESGLLDLVRRMSPSNRPFQYDVATYVVAERFARDRYLDGYPYGYGYWGYDPYWPRFGGGFWFRRHSFGYLRGWGYR
jgi:uncharacterized protein DUF4384